MINLFCFVNINVNIIDIYDTFSFIILIDVRQLKHLLKNKSFNKATPSNLISDTIFNEAKSENKWVEAALCKVVTVASNFGAFKTAITDGIDGLLCNNEEEWYKKLTKEIGRAHV